MSLGNLHSRLIPLLTVPYWAGPILFFNFWKFLVFTTGNLPLMSNYPSFLLMLSLWSFNFTIYGAPKVTIVFLYLQLDILEFGWRILYLRSLQTCLSPFYLFWRQRFSRVLKLSRGFLSLTDDLQCITDAETTQGLDVQYTDNQLKSHLNILVVFRAWTFWSRIFKVELEIWICPSSI